MTASPKTVATVAHHGKDNEGRQLGHIGVVQRRAPEKIARFGGKRWASWAQLTRAGVPDQVPERFDTFERQPDAVAHAKYAASRAP